MLMTCDRHTDNVLVIYEGTPKISCPFCTLSEEYRDCDEVLGETEGTVSRLEDKVAELERETADLRAALEKLENTN